MSVLNIPIIEVTTEDNVFDLRHALAKVRYLRHDTLTEPAIPSIPRRSMMNGVVKEMGPRYRLAET